MGKKQTKPPHVKGENPPSRLPICSIAYKPPTNRGDKVGETMSELNPKTIEQVIGANDSALPYFYIDEWKENPPTNLLFDGVPGTGKTTAAYVLAHELGYTLYELNASDERGIDAIRKRIKELSMSAGLWNKIMILLDEADGLTKQAQEALRRIMETSDCIFVLTCNNMSAIIPALRSRCTRFTFKPHSATAVRAYVDLLKKENIIDVAMQTDAEELAIYFGGDLRAIQKHLISNLPLPQVQQEMDMAALQIAAGDWESLHRTMSGMVANGVNAHGLMHRIHEHVLSIGLDSKQLYTFLSVWGDFVLRMHEWPLGVQSFLDYFVATLYTQDTQNKTGE